MPEVKIVLASEAYEEDYGNYYHRAEIKGTISDWEEISEEELTWLRKYIHEIPTPWKFWHYIILVKDDVPVMARLDSIKGFIKDEKKKQEEKRLAKEEINRKRQETKRKRQEEKELKELERLKEKYAS